MTCCLREKERPLQPRHELLTVSVVLGPWPSELFCLPCPLLSFNATPNTTTNKSWVKAECYKLIHQPGRCFLPKITAADVMSSRRGASPLPLTV
jgi:hypothetical protein